MEDASLQVNLGAVQSLTGRLSFAFVVHSSGAAHLQVYASDPSNTRKAGVLLTLDESRYEPLKEIIGKTDETIRKLRASGQMRQMLVKYGD